MSILKNHLVIKIKNQIDKKQDSINFDGKFYFDQEILDENTRCKINSIGRQTASSKDRQHPISLHTLKPSTLMKICDIIGNNDFYLFKKVDGKEYKIRLKR